jgi:hypothetical protein
MEARMPEESTTHLIIKELFALLREIFENWRKITVIAVAFLLLVGTIKFDQVVGLVKQIPGLKGLLGG